MTRLIEIAGVARKTTIGELLVMPYRYLHSLYYLLYQRQEYDRKHPKEAEQRMQGEALQEALSG